MLRQQVGTARHRPTADTTVSGRRLREDFDAVHVRNYDHAAGHSIQLTLTDASGRVRLAERCYLAPGQSRRVGGALAPGEYRIAVRIDGVDRTTAACRLGPSPARTAAIELGDGAVSVTQGPDGLVSG